MYKNIFKEKKAVIFDLNGTIVKETEEIKVYSFIEALKQLGLTYIDPRPYCTPGASIRSVWANILKFNKIPNQVNTENLVQKTNGIFEEIVKKSSFNLVDGFWDIVYELKEKNIKIALVTNTSENIMNKILEILGIQNLFDIKVSAEDKSKFKPDPFVYKKVLNLLKLKAKNALAFEDSVIGVTSAEKAGIDTIVLWDGKTSQKLFKGNVVDFTKDFTPYYGKMEDTKQEYMNKLFDKAKRNFQDK